MACTGVPEPQPKHALLMVRFAWDCLIEMDKLCNLLEVTLGPETTKLGMRIGLHRFVKIKKTLFSAKVQ